MIFENENRIKELNSFKNEILKLLNGVELKLLEQINLQNIDLSSKITDFEDRIEAFQKEHFSMKSLFTDQKLKMEKINDYERFQKKADALILTHDIRLNRALNDLDYLKSKYDKIILENLTVAGFIGPSCTYKTIGDYLFNNIKENSKNKSEKEQMKLEINNIKQKIDNMHRNIMTLIEAGVNRSNNYTNNKTESFNDLINRKFEDMNNKFVEMKMRDIQTKLEMEKKIKEFKKYFDEIKEMRKYLENNDEKNNNIFQFENRKFLRRKNKENTFIINYNSLNSEKNIENSFFNIELKKERKYSVKTKSYRGVKKIEKEEIIEKKNKKKNAKNPKIIEEKLNEEEENKNKDIININNNINDIKINLKKYENEFKVIKQNINDINSKIKFFDLIMKPIFPHKSKKIIKNTEPQKQQINTEPENTKKRKESKILQTSLENNDINSHTQEKFYPSDENKREDLYEKIYKNILINHYKKNYKKIDIDNNIKPKIYDICFSDEKNKTQNKRFYSPINTMDKTNYNYKFKNNLNNELAISENNDIENNRNIKDLFLLKYNKMNILKENNTLGLKVGLEKNIINSIKNLIKENNTLKNKNILLSPRETEKTNLSNNKNIVYQNKMSQTTENDNNLKSIQTDNESKIYYKLINFDNNKNENNNYFRNKHKLITTDKNIDRTNKPFLSPIVDKLYKEFYIKNNLNKEKNSSNIINFPKKIIPAFGRTSYAPLKEIKKSNSDKSRIRIKSINYNKDNN